MDCNSRHVLNKNTLENNKSNFIEALIPLISLMVLLFYNITFADGVLLGEYSNQFILLICGTIAAIVGYCNKIPTHTIFSAILVNIKSVITPIIILLLVGALAGTWLVSGVIPTMVYYGLKVLSAEIFLPTALIISAIISIATGSSWTTSATVGIALIGIGATLGINTSIIAGAVISGAYFGDKMSPLSDTTNLAPAMSGTDLFTHIKYMSFTTIPTFIITLIVFIFLSFTTNPTENSDTTFILNTIDQYFNISPILFAVPIAVIVLILLKIKPSVALTSGVLLAVIFAFIFQTKLLNANAKSPIKTIVKSIFFENTIEISNDAFLKVFSNSDLEKINNDNNGLKNLFSNNDLKGIYTTETLKNILSPETKNTSIIQNKIENLEKLITLKRLKKLFRSTGMKGMLWTIYLILCAMIFGGIMEGIGALSRITNVLLSKVKSVFGLFASTVISCLGLNTIASDQYLAIVIPGKMFKKAFEDRNLAPENLSRTLEDSATVTSVLIPWNTCGAYQSSVLGVGVGEYFLYAVFNWLSPFTTLFFAAFSIKLRQLSNPK